MTVTDGFRRVLTVSCGHGSHPSVKLGQFDRTKIGLRGSIPSWPLWDMSPRLPALRRKTNSPPLHPGFSATMPGAIWCWARGGNRLVVRRPELAPRLGWFPRRGRPHPPLVPHFPTRSAMSKEPASVSWFVLLSDRQPFGQNRPRERDFPGRAVPRLQARLPRWKCGLESRSSLSGSWRRAFFHGEPDLRTQDRRVAE